MNPKRVLISAVWGALLVALVGTRESGAGGTKVLAAVHLAPPAGATSTSVSTSTTTPTPAPACTPIWQVVDSPNAPGGDNSLNGLAAISADDVWAVGSVGSSPDIQP